MQLTEAAGHTATDDEGVALLEQVRQECEAMGAEVVDEPPPAPQEILLSTILSHRTKQGVVELTVNGTTTQLDVGKATLMKLCEKCGAEYPDHWTGRCINTIVVNSQQLDACGGELHHVPEKTVILPEDQDND